LRLSEQIRSTHDQDGAVLLDIRQGQMFRLNRVGSRILELLKLGYPESRITDEISREFGAARGTVEIDLREFLSQLAKHCLVQHQKPESPAAL
jgi:hypothetical protein